MRVRPETLAALLLGGQVLLIGLDLLDDWRRRDSRGPAQRLRVRSIAFLGAVIVVYGAMQVGGLALAPTGEELLAWAGASLWPDADATLMRAPSPAAAVLLGASGFYVAGFWDYIVHRYVSHNRLLWFTHENHHLPTRVAVYMPGMCVRPFAVVTVFPATLATLLSIFALLRVAGVGPVELRGVLYSVVLVQVTVLGMSHSQYLRRHPLVHSVLRRFGITTPQEHRLHHTPDLQGNFGNFTTLWDRVFGTYLDPEIPAFRGHRAGLAYGQDFLGAVTLGRFRLPARWRSYFQLERFCYLGRG